MADALAPPAAAPMPQLGGGDAPEPRTPDHEQPDQGAESLPAGPGAQLEEGAGATQGAGDALFGPGGGNLTFAWAGTPVGADGPRTHYRAFSFCSTHYTVGDHVYLIPEDPSAPLYLARIISAFEDASQEGGDRLCIEVQWYERRANMPAHLQEGMHDREVVEWLQTDTNLVGCIERKARVIRARGHDEAAALMSINHPAEAAGEWHFCRGVLDCDSGAFRTYEEVDADPAMGFDPRHGMVIPLAHAAYNGHGNGLAPPITVDLFQPAEAPASSKRGGKGGKRGASSAASSASGGARRGGGRQARGFVGDGAGGVPGQVCCECGQTSTPQWREGPAGPRTLCNACGMRYQRSQGKGQNRPRSRGSDELEVAERKSARTTRGRGRGRGRRGGSFDEDLSSEETEDLVLSDEDD
ncbi:GATA type zinc finger transcription factor family [Raphidocelis subcapitata]|uniref:GATA type zinc finger transcription factor family n=1 Tax=Raphidocelis subcapitata TaxID=307507 RepID=A0A2V0PMB7_9CHLO|nr:GATA type zinc finger transcription factor family [Raphidocelis subcapitata]|eukprot:GBF98497.1 GATA type zinc finger transcription factor family [Raphidocelis subcapitata]